MDNAVGVEKAQDIQYSNDFSVKTTAAEKEKELVPEIPILDNSSLDNGSKWEEIDVDFDDDKPVETVEGPEITMTVEKLPAIPDTTALNGASDEVTTPTIQIKTKSKNSSKKLSSSNRLQQDSALDSGSESVLISQNDAVSIASISLSSESNSPLKNELSILRKALSDTKELMLSKEKSFSEQMKSAQEDLIADKNNSLKELKELLANENAKEINLLKREYETKLLSLSTDGNDSDEHQITQQIAALNSALSEQDQRINQLNNSIATKTSENQKLTFDLSKVKEALADRERALETAAKSMSDLHKQQQDLTSKVSDLHSEIAEKDARLRQLQSSSAEEAELRKQLAKAQDLLKEQNERLAAFQQEGQSLAKKQGEMEKLVRKGKSDLKEKETEITKLKESKDQLIKAMQELQDLLKKHETDANNSSKSLTAMQAVSQASAEKLAKLEAEINSRSDELASQRRALENAWNENNELKRSIAELKADRDDLRRQLGEGTSRVMETESSRRDIEQREAVLRATSKQLQESLQRQMQEAAIREERLREEISEMRQRWQEAVSSRESLTAELGNASTPLVSKTVLLIRLYLFHFHLFLHAQQLRQISSLQEAIRVKAENWQSIESTLSERALRAENAMEIAEHKKNLIEEQYTALKLQHSTITTRINELQNTISILESDNSRLKRLESGWEDSRSDLESRLALEVAQRQNLQSSLREFELRHKIEVQNLVESASIQSTQKELEISKLKKDLDVLMDTTRNSNSAVRQKSLSAVSDKASSKSSSNGRSNHNISDHDGEDGFLGHRRNVSQSMPGVLPSGEMSFAANEKMQQRSRQRDDDLRTLQGQVQQLTDSRNALLEEVNFLSLRNAQLEEQCVKLPQIVEELTASKKRIDVLLVMLGEKEEELEAAMSDVRDVKDMYKHHIEDLMGRLTKSDNAVSKRD